jgi:hypothetical protein
MQGGSGVPQQCSRNDGTSDKCYPGIFTQVITDEGQEQQGNPQHDPYERYHHARPTGENTYGGAPGYLEGAAFFTSDCIGFEFRSAEGTLHRLFLKSKKTNTS